MKQLIGTLLLLCCLLPGLAPAQEVIEDFAVQLRVGSDGLLEVTERITVQAEGQQIRRGIYRDLPVLYRLPGGLLRKTPIDLLAVTRDGQPEAVRREMKWAHERFYLGSPLHLLKPGRYVYELHYRVDPQLLHRPDEDELYWNVTGNDWSFPILRASAQLQLPAAARIGDAYAYTGAVGQQGMRYRLSDQGGAFIALETTEPLPPGHGLTLAVDWQAGLVQRPTPGHTLWRLMRDNPGLGLGGLLWLFTLGYYLWAWWRVGRDPRKGLHIVRFEAPDELRPAQVGYLWHRGFRKGFYGSRALAVCFTDWAIRGLIRLEDLPQAEGFSLTLGKVPFDRLPEDEAEWLRQLFAPGKADKPLNLGGRYQVRLAKMEELMVNSLASAGRQWHAGNRRAWFWGLILALPGILLSVLPGMQGEDRWVGGLFGLIFGAAFGVPALLGLVSAIRQRSIGQVLPALLFGVPAVVGLGLLAYFGSLPMLLLVLAYLLLLVAFYGWLEAPSVKGQELLDALAGYRDYLQLAESDVLQRAAGAPAMSIELFERHLPFAMALGVEEAWSARFAAALASGLIDPEQQDYRPDWYRTRSGIGSPDAFAGALATNLSSASARASTPPSSPSSSSGGSSGRGSSGGGRGGGGGGGW